MREEERSRAPGPPRREESDPRAALLEQVYGPLRALAARYLRRRPADGLQPTSLVHEVFLRVIDRDRVPPVDQAHFFALCATALRGILVDHARRRAVRGPRAGSGTHIYGVADLGPNAVEVLAVDDALTQLAVLDERQARIVEYRYFAGMTIPEVAHVLGVSPRTVDKDWAMARAWLSVRLSGEGAR